MPGTALALDWAALVTETAERTTAFLDGLAPATAWSRPAGRLEWSCHATLDHLALGITGYAGLLTAKPRDRYITLFASLDPQAPVSARLEGIRVAASFLASAVRAAAPEDRAWHPWGHSDGPGFAAMGVVEAVVHTHDIATGLGVGWTPPDELAGPALARLFPGVPHEDEPGLALLRATGRIARPGERHLAEWSWDGTVR
ncbi:maleylpyruvate isomerase N-terminal domain-containing protein [Streptomyces mobaraensis]|uniref:maleylpyruvate isomerase N-terminal domain-containing protein n=1 Tax=Streptomyces sp. TYQ1024 TaxID=2762559 RepID=UPI001CCFA9E5|nr:MULTISPECIES: maleylpyruvate isomerase N-terminal domain-containing protein [Streptomyces]UBI41050.1 maleylpyruvate isomerase N-terminal domain-containing protein [Streptomyces mobaraensis]UKW33535.1 maleylpyruvate isomerase N-terminal domain-containing protein [Streptomyces sp. TYQ1024]